MVSGMLIRALWKFFSRLFVVIAWLASIAGATEEDYLRWLLMPLPWFKDPWVWVIGLILTSSVIAWDLATLWSRRHRSSTKLRINKDLTLWEDPDKRAMRRWAHTVIVQNMGGQDIEANCLVKVTDAWNEVGYAIDGLPLVLRPTNQIRENRNQPFNLRAGEPKTVVVGFSFSLSGPRNWVEFVDGSKTRRVTFDDFLTRWLVVRMASYGGGAPSYVTGVFVLHDWNFTFRPRRNYEIITKSRAAAEVRRAYRRYLRSHIHTGCARVATGWGRTKRLVLVNVAHGKRRLRRLLRATWLQK